MKMKQIKNKKIVVTGGAGFIGSNITRAIMDNNEVTIIDDLSTGRYENVKDILEKIRFVKKTINNIRVLKKEFKNTDFVIHQAAIPSVPRSVDKPIESNHANITGTLNVLNEARNAGVKRVVYAASSSAYGNQPKLPKKEDMKMDPLSPYAIGKLTGEYYCKVFHEVYGLETIGLRYFNVFGPRQDPASHYSAVIPLFIKAIINNKRPTVFGDGLQSRDFTFIENNVQANILACLTKEKKALGQTMNLACGERISLLGLIKLINKIEGKNIKPKFAPERKGDVKHSLADISMVKRLLGYKPHLSFEEGLKRTIKWYKEGNE